MANSVLSFLNHENPHIRAEALRVYYRVKGAEGKVLYLDLLNDSDVNVQKEAIECLARVVITSYSIHYTKLYDPLFI